MKRRIGRRRHCRIAQPASRAIEALEGRMLLSLSPAGAEFRANTFTTGSQFGGSIAMDGDGDFVITWHSTSQDGSPAGIYAQLYNAGGAAVGGEFLVNTYTTGNQNNPTVAMNPLGDFVIAWASPQDGNSYGVYAQRFNAVGAKQGPEFRVNTYTTNSQAGATAAMDAAGNFVITWQSNGQDGSAYGVYAQRYSAAGVAQGSEFRANTYTTSNQNGCTAVIDADGDFVILWQSNGQDGSSYGVYAQRYNAAGAPQGPEFRVNSTTANNQSAAAAAIDADGDFVISWSANGQDGSSYGVYAQRYNAAGVPQGLEFRVNSYTTNLQAAPAIAIDANGDFVVTWTSLLQDGNSYGIYAQAYNAAGTPQGTELHVSTFTTGSQGSPIVAMDAAGDVVVAWQSNLQDGNQYGVYAQRFDESTDTAGPVIGGVFVNGNRVQPYGAVGGPVSQIVVGFSEALNEFGGPNSVANPANWRITHHNGTTTSNVPILSIDYHFNAGANRFEATLNLSTSFAVGDLQLIALDTIRDVAGNALDGNLDGTSGGSASLTFGIGASAPRGGQFRVNTYTTSLQGSSAIATDADGDFVVAWRSPQDGGQYGVYAQRFNALGVAQGSEFRVNTFTTSSQGDPGIGMDADGDFVIAWASSGQDGSSYGVYAQRYNALGVAQGSEFQVNTFTTSSQGDPGIGMDADGDFVIAWHSDGQDGSSNGIYAQRYNALGVAQGSEFQVNTFTTSNQSSHAIGMDADGDFVIAWHSDGQDGSSNGIYAQRYNALGVAQGSEFQVNTFTTSSQRFAAIEMDAAGDFVITWQSYRDGSLYGIYAQRYNALGVAQSSEFQVNTFTTSSQRTPAIGLDADGDFVIAWTSDGQDGDWTGIYAQRYNAFGVAQSSEFRVNTFTTSSQGFLAIGMDADGDFVITWSSLDQDGSSYGIYAQRYGLGATPIVGLLSDSPDLAPVGTPVTLTASGITDDMFATRVLFYREANGIAGLQFGIDGDTPLATDNVGGDGWSTIIATSSLSPGTYSYYAQAIDDEGLAGTPASTTHTVAMAVLGSAFHFNVLQQKLTFSFDANAVNAGLGLEDMVLEKIGGGSVPALAMLPYGTDGTNVASFTMDTQLADGNYRATINAAGVSGGGTPLSGNYIFDIFILAGDANHDRIVNAYDLEILALNWLGTGKTWSQADFDYNGVVNAIDLGILGTHWQQTLAQPAAPLPASPTSTRAPARTAARTPTRVIDLVL